MKQLDDFVHTGHPLREIREMVNKALVAIYALFTGLYEADIKGGGPSIATEKFLRAMLIRRFGRNWSAQGEWPDLSTDLHDTRASPGLSAVSLSGLQRFRHF